MLTIGQLAAYAGVTVRAVRHYHQIGLLPEPERDTSGYRRYGARSVVSLIKIRTLAEAGVPLAEIGQLLEADAPAFAAAIQRIDHRLSERVDRIENSRRQIAQLASGDSLMLAPEGVAFLERLREIGTSERIVAGERDGWILVAARWPEFVSEWMPKQIEHLDDPRQVRIYQLMSELVDTGNEAVLEEIADIMADLNELALTSGEVDVAEAMRDELPFDLLDSLAVEHDPRMKRLQTLLRERGWNGMARLERFER